jgi:hypothetical protein
MSDNDDISRNCDAALVLHTVYTHHNVLALFAVTECYIACYILWTSFTIFYTGGNQRSAPSCGL